MKEFLGNIFHFNVNAYANDSRWDQCRYVVK